jgi:hypothetical protein
VTADANFALGGFPIWTPAVSSDGVAVMVSRLRQRALVTGQWNEDGCMTYANYMGRLARVATLRSSCGPGGPEACQITRRIKDSGVTAGSDLAGPSQDVGYGLAPGTSMNADVEKLAVSRSRFPVEVRAGALACPVKPFDAVHKAYPTNVNERPSSRVNTNDRSRGSGLNISEPICTDR